jgi:hypothetical protein
VFIGGIFGVQELIKHTDPTHPDKKSLPVALIEMQVGLTSAQFDSVYLAVCCNAALIMHFQLILTFFYFIPGFVELHKRGEARQRNESESAENSGEVRLNLHTRSRCDICYILHGLTSVLLYICSITDLQMVSQI